MDYQKIFLLLLVDMPEVQKVRATFEDLLRNYFKLGGLKALDLELGSSVLSSQRVAELFGWTEKLINDPEEKASALDLDTDQIIAILKKMLENSVPLAEETTTSQGQISLVQKGEQFSTITLKQIFK